MRRWSVGLACVALLGCSDARPVGDAGGVVDAGGQDAGADAERADAGPSDAGSRPVTRRALFDDVDDVTSTDVVLDASESVHVVFAQPGRVTYLSEAGGWSPEVVLDGPTVRGAVHLAVHDGVVFVSLVELVSRWNAVVYQRSVAGEWTRRVVYDGEVASLSAPIVATSTGVFVSWGVFTSGTGGVEDHVVFATYDHAAWSSTRFLNRGRPHALTVDSRGLVHAAFTSAPLGRMPYLAHLRDLGSMWIIYEVADVVPDPDAQIAVDASDRPHLVYRDSSAGELVYAHSWRAGQPFEPTVLEESDAAPLGIAVGPDDVALVAYHRSSSRDLVLARVGDEVERELLAEEGDVGRALSMTISRDGRAHVVHHDATARRLELVVR